MRETPSVADGPHTISDSEASSCYVEWRAVEADKRPAPGKAMAVVAKLLREPYPNCLMLSLRTDPASQCRFLGPSLGSHFSPQRACRLIFCWKLLPQFRLSHEVLPWLPSPGRPGHNPLPLMSIFWLLISFLTLHNGCHITFFPIRCDRNVGHYEVDMTTP